MESIREIYKIGYGPSSSHTMGPKKAAELFLKKNPGVDSFRVTLFGSLAATGKGHLTDLAIADTFAPIPVELIWNPTVFLPFHPNALTFEAIGTDDSVQDIWTAYSVGGGTIVDDHHIAETKLIYPDTGMDNILKWCYQSGKSIWEYAVEYESSDLLDYLNEVWKVMQDAILRGLDTEGPLPGELHYPRKASAYYVKARNFKSSMKKRGMVYAYALAVSEENASGGKIVTAPTCGACGIMPSVLYYMKKFQKISDKKILKAVPTSP